MEINEYLEIKQTIQRKLIDYLDYDDNMEENFRNLIDFFQKHKLHEDRQEIDNIKLSKFEKAKRIISPIDKEKIFSIIFPLKNISLKKFQNVKRGSIYRVKSQKKYILIGVLRRLQ